jgi:hypothetical protein
VQAGVFLYDTTQLKIMTQQHPITPPPELVQQWLEEADTFRYLIKEVHQHIATRAAQWGADQELEACCEWLNRQGRFVISKELRAARRPKPLTLNSIALQMLGTIERDAHYLPEITDTIRRALEALPDE